MGASAVERSWGDVALMFTDIESSMHLWTADARAMAASLEVHDRMLTDEIESGAGTIFTRAGDSFAAAFDTAAAAATVAVRCQRRLARLSWPGPALRVRIGVHVGPVQMRDGDYFGPDVSLAARVGDAGHGGQIVVTTPVAEAVRPREPTTLLGSYVLKGWGDLVELHQVGDGEFPELRADRESSEAVRFDGFELDPAARTLRSEGHPIDVQPQVFDVLLHLVENRGRLVSREELLDEVWGDQFVSMSALTTRIKQARQALDDDGRAQRYIRNERGRGYQFVGEVDVAPTRDHRVEVVASATSSVSTPDSAIFGRRDDLVAVDGLLAESRLVTIVGPGGVGKTTLVEALAERMRDEGRNSVLVHLDGIRDVSGLLPTLTTALGLADPGDEPVVACADWLAATGRTLILDNCEHLLDPVAGLARTIIDSSTDVSVVATSRQPLGLLAESIHRLDPFRVPDASSRPSTREWPCLELFASVARRAGGMAIASDDDWRGVAELCRRLDGLPLAIELAASRVSTLGVRDLLGGLDDRLDWIRTRSTDAGERQQSLRSTVEWSFRYLHEDCLDLIAALALFPAGLRLPDVTMLASRLDLELAVDELVSRLVDASVVTGTPTRGEARYSMLETIRQFGLEHLAEHPSLDSAARRHLREHALSVAQAERDAWTGDIDPRGRSLRRLRDEVPNLRAARNAMLAAGEPADAVRLAVGLCAFTEEACLAELWSWHEVPELDAAREADPEVAAGALLLEATIARNRGEIEACRAAADEAADLSTDRWIVGRARHTAAMASLFGGDPVRAGELWLESDQHLGGCRGRLFAAMAAAFAGDLDLASSHLRHCHIDDDSRVPIDLFTNLHLVRGEIARVADTGDARDEFEQATAVAREHGLLFSVGIAQVPLVAILEADGDTAAAASGYRELLELFLTSGTWTQVWTTLRNAARLLVSVDPGAALLICHAAPHDPRAPALDEAAARECDELVDRATDALGADEAGQIQRRAALVAPATVVRDTVAALGERV